ncbi:MAG: CHAT domain-containing protein, partial [Pyrinomonadaceae bacterium]
GLIEGKRFLDADFSVKNLTDSLNGRFNIVHFASHFRLGPDWSSSALILGGGSLLSLKDISSTPAISFADVELVTLSACNTALTTSSNGIEVDSLAEAIQAKSGKAVLATLWSVYDESTSSLMKDFYRIKTSDPSLTKAAALQQAQKKMIADAKFSHPYYWSPFTLIGDWR